MRYELHPHPESRPDPRWSIVANLAPATPGRFELSFTLEGGLEKVRIPDPAPVERKDELWRHTCFEAFIMPAGGPAYYEINLSPSGAWAAYHFESYRTGMAPALDAPPVIFPMRGRDKLSLSAALAGLPDDMPRRLGLSAVVEAVDGSKSYWALAHPPGKPDFHHRDCFALELAPAA